jgi:putative membrane protein
LNALLATLVLVCLVLSGIAPRDRLTWFLEVSWVIAGLPLAIFVHRRYRLTSLLLWLLAFHALVLILGGHYTYAHVPLGRWAQDWFGWSRNHYDRLGHLVQGFVPAILVRELLARASPLAASRWLGPLVVCACLAFSAFFEMIEWWAALVYGEEATAYLATQGDVWDTQWDMFLAMAGATASLLLLRRWHDRQLRSVRGSRFEVQGSIARNEL